VQFSSPPLDHKLTNILEFLTKLRKHCIEGTVDENYGSHAKFIDAAGYWQCMHQQSRDEIDQLLATISLLERDKGKLETQVRSSRVVPMIKGEDVTRPSTSQPRSGLEELSRPSTAQPRSNPGEPLRPSTAQPRSAMSKKRKMPFRDDTRLQHKSLKAPTAQLQGAGGEDAPIVIVDESTRLEEPKGIGEYNSCCGIQRRY
jgi:hypothetical protein